MVRNSRLFIGTAVCPNSNQKSIYALALVNAGKAPVFGGFGPFLGSVEGREGDHDAAVGFGACGGGGGTDALDADPLADAL